MRLAMLIPIAGAATLLATPVWANDRELNARSNAGVSQIEYVVHGQRDIARRRGFDAEWDGSSLHFSLDRIRRGDKNEFPQSTTGSPWARQISLDGRYEHEIASGLSVSINGRATYAKSGTVDGPLLTRRSAVLSREIGVSLLSPTTYLALLQFRSGGWDGAVLGDTANRMANGEAAARRGLALEAGFGGIGRPRLALRIENARAGTLGLDNRAFVSWRASF
ncbi:hypothetical protein K3181_11975 [Qipengyuania sp. YG27]|uniref:DUF2219 family protein n=1 Tax=Qipengyuania mesophila TaxID=2867246 RepID=A0ABS7JWZ0_9SPHN|nr:hypothetical protein [Qipengyuania mesophila]MBX7502160.1 hypothetical protein [Qipengyuania mesophila]